jgi:hypothetical protein
MLPSCPEGTADDHLVRHGSVSRGDRLTMATPRVADDHPHETGRLLHAELNRQRITPPGPLGRVEWGADVACSVCSDARESTLWIAASVLFIRCRACVRTNNRT